MKRHQDFRFRRTGGIPAWTSAFLLSLGLLRGAAGQQPSQAAPAQLRLNDAVQLAVHNYPAVLAAQRAALAEG